MALKSIKLADFCRDPVKSIALIDVTNCKEFHFSICRIVVFCICNILGLVDEQQKVRTISALAIAALAEAATPYGIESFDSVLKPLWKGIRQHRGKVTSWVLLNFFVVL